MMACDKMYTKILCLVLSALHSLLIFLDDLLLELSACWHGLFSKDAPDTLQTIQKLHKSRVTKRADHVAVAVLEPDSQVSLTKLGHLVVWILASDARCLSIYDISGFLKQRQQLLLQAIEAAFASYSPSPLQEHFHLHWSAPAAAACSSGAQGKCVQLNLLTVDEGIPDIVDTARHLCVLVRQGQLDASVIDVNLVDQHLRSKRGFDDPDILIRVGGSRSNMGFLPWQTRLTEIYDVAKSKHLRFATFFSILTQFSQCEQRFGR